jgi:hypothetical protein
MPEVQVSGWGLQLGRIASRRFVQVREDGSAAGVRELLAAYPKAFLLVRGMEPGFWLLSAEEAQDLLEEASEATVGEALAAAGISPVQTRDAASDFEEAPDRCVVLEAGEPIGFYDIDVDIPEVLRGRGMDEELLPRMLVAEMARRVAQGSTVSLLVSLVDLELAGEDGIPLALPAGSAVDIYVSCRRGFELEGEQEARLVVTEEPRTLPARFLLRAVDLGAGEIELFAFHGASCLGKLTLAPLVVEKEQRASPVVSMRYEGELSGPGPRPDLELVIQEVGSPLRPELLIRFRRSEAGAEVKTFGPIPLGLDPLLYFEDFFRNVEALEGEDGPAREIAERQLASRGADLFTAILPEELQVLLWSLRDRIRTLRIESQEPWIPWELCRLVGRQGGRIVEGSFFCEQFAMTRWLLGLKPKTELRLRRIGLIAPAGTGLEAAAEECEERLGITQEGVRVESLGARYLDVVQALACGEYDGLHFAGHGRFSASADADRASLELEDGPLRPWNVSGIACNLGRSSPLVFLNACQAGRAGVSLTGMGGWAPRFLRAGAGAFVGPYWSVRDRSAACFARAFYRELLAGEPIGEAGRKARLEVREKHPGNPTWLAYTVYADPLARLIG